MKFREVTNLDELNEMLTLIEWHDTFIREFYYLDSSYVINEKHNLNNPENGNLILLILSESEEYSGIEIIFTKVKQVNINLNNDIMDVVGSQINGDFIIKFGGSTEMISTGLQYRFVGKEVWGNRNRYSGKVFFDLDEPLLIE